MNQLASEKSPYLLQHVDNPVDWYPWSQSLFDLARKESKLIFLSIGYSTCHWCHVMAHECFEDEEVAALLNKNYLSIKVDREERPDIDMVYMEVCQRLTGSGGWPLTIIMTPDAKPFYAATYIPKHGRHGRPGLMDLLPWVTEKWRDDPDFLVSAADEIVAEILRGADASQSQGLIDARMHEDAERALRHGFDQRFGGFGRAPKFPRPHDLRFLLERYQASGDNRCLAMVEQTLLNMRCGGIYDHLGGGFHRYSTDEEWLVPHFEKMLYDQAGLVEAYLQAWQATDKNLYAETVREVLGYLCRDMLSPQGAVFSAEDADSEGEEGTFYLWTKGEIEAILGDDADSFIGAYNIKPVGNYHDEVSGQLTGKNILHLSAANVEDIPHYSQQRKSLFTARTQRIRPHLDDKVIAAWNGMAMSAFARAGKALDDELYVARAHDIAKFVLQYMCEDNGRLLRRFRQGEAAIQAFSEDYAFVARGLLDLYGCDFNITWMKSSIALANCLRMEFQDSENGRLYDTSIDGEELLVRPCSRFDGATPAAASIAMEVYGRLFLLTGDVAWRDSAEKLMGSLSHEVRRSPAGYTQLLLATNWLLLPTREIVVVEGADGVLDSEMLAFVNGFNLSNTVVLHKTIENAEDLSAVAPFTDAMRPVDGQTTVYVCQGFSCHQPVTSRKALMECLAT